MQENRFDSREAASIAAAQHVVTALERRLEGQGNASLIVGGGTSPVRCFEELSRADIRWQDVAVALSDERWVSPDHDNSNEKLIRETLLQGAAAEASFFGMYVDDCDVSERCDAIAAELRRMPFPFACSLLGMGTDGHFASLFPDAESLDEALDPECPTLCIPVRTAASPHERISLTLTPISRSDEVLLLIFGDEKWHTLQDAKASQDAYPVSRLLGQKRAPVSVYWAS